MDKETIAKLQNIYGQVDNNVCELMKKEFPELVESRDELMRKMAIKAVYAPEAQSCIKSWGVSPDDVIAWLEKQGEQMIAKGERKNIALSIINYLDNNRVEGCMDLSSMECEDLENAVMNSDWGKVYCYMRKKLEKQDEQKPADKVEPKFHKDDWVVFELNGSVYQIKSIENVSNHKYGYYLTNGCYMGSDEVNYYHLWTIQDAKDGDVLVTSEGSIFLFAGAVDWACKYYVALTTDNIVKFNEGLEHYWETSRAVHPATKEQCDLLFQKMKEAGYEWNPEKKELRRKPKFKAGDWVVYEGLTYLVIKDVAEYTLKPCGSDLSQEVVVCYADEDKLHLWTIKDAKDGDVLFTRSTTGSSHIFIFKNIDENNNGKCYYGCDSEDSSKDGFIARKYDFDAMVTNCIPATKEQRNTLFAKMHEAGYEWDAEKKELKKIDWNDLIKYNPNPPSIMEENSAWSEEDDNYLFHVLGIIDSNISWPDSTKELLKGWLKSFKERVHTRN